MMGEVPPARRSAIRLRIYTTGPEGIRVERPLARDPEPPPCGNYACSCASTAGSATELDDGKAPTK